MLKNVVLPAPFGPIRLTIEPCGIVKSRSLTATRPPNSLRTSSARSRSVTTLLVLDVVERLIGNPGLQLALPTSLTDQPLRPEEHHDDEDGSEDPRRVQRDVDRLAEDLEPRRVAPGEALVDPAADIAEPLLVQVGEEGAAEDPAPDAAHAAEDDHAEDEDRDVEEEVVGKGPALEAGEERAGNAAEESTCGVG